MLDSVLGVNRAQNWDVLRTALKDFGAPSQTFLYADVDGNIGVQVPGLIPIRRRATVRTRFPARTTRSRSSTELRPV